jgi:hypothetical protein
MCKGMFTAHGFRCRVVLEPGENRWVAWVELESVAGVEPAITAIRRLDDSFATEHEARAAAEVYAKVVAFSGLRWA